MNIPIGTSSAFYLDLYGRYRRDPGSVPVDWRIQFEELDGAAAPAATTANDLPRRLLEAYRTHAHLEARLDPLGLERPRPVGMLERLRAEVRAAPEIASAVVIGTLRLPDVGGLAAALESVYARGAALEAAAVEDEEAREWLHAAYEAAFTAEADPRLAERALESIALADTFETFVATKFPSKKRFGVEGAEASIVFLRELLREACLSGFAETTIGGMHRGRLAQLATVLGKPVGTLLAEIKGRDLTEGGPDFTGDVPYHLGYAGELAHDGRSMRVAVSPHPSHLMTVAPVVVGLARGKRRRGADDVLCLLLHTDAAFSGQGLTSEVLQLGGLAGYEVGGTIHLVVNNQIGFTTTPSEGRSSRSCTDVGKVTGAPVLHLNGDDPVAAMRVAHLALAWRRRFGRDILIDLVCYRRNGHNELDEPRFTQPRIWSAVEARPSLREAFGAEIGRNDPGARERTDAAAASFRAEMQRGYDAIDSLRPNQSPGRPAAWHGVPRADTAMLLERVETGVPTERLRALGLASSTVPAGFRPHLKVAQFYERRRETIATGRGINLATAEALAFATLLAEGIPVRLSGQDSVRGTFTQRHLRVFDVDTGGSAVPLDAAAADGARFEPVNSPLSEYAVLGFEYGHSLADPNRLTLWEAQFGDFLNGAQVVVDQFIVSAEAKWEMMSGLVVLLPHGLEGQGPDHSSARIERLLQATAGANVVVANVSTPANLFHLLRRQIRAPWRKPLFVIGPKSLLRQRDCVSRLDEMGPGTAFRPVIAEAPRPECRRVVMCSGKIAYDLARTRATLGLDREVALIRLEQLHPFPMADLLAAIAPCGDAEWVWCQEEAENQGALAHVLDLLRREPATATRPVATVARPRLAVAAGGSIERHEMEQDVLVRDALDGSGRR